MYTEYLLYMFLQYKYYVRTGLYVKKANYIHFIFHFIF